MNYEPKFIDGITVDVIDAEIKQMHEEQYRYGRSIDYPRMWDLLHTKTALIEQEDWKRRKEK